MSWRIEIRHHTGYHYRGEVVASYNEARITPLTTPRQLVIEATVAVSPSAKVFRYWDYWGTIVDAFDIHVPHTELVVTGSSVVETSPPDEVPDIGWDELARPEVRDRFAELLGPTAFVTVAQEVAEAARSLAAGRSPAEACQAAVDWVRGQLRYERGTTNVSTSATEALHQGSGVCQDFVHLTLALQRAMGIPARYTSGYLHPSPEAGVGATVAGQSHAWVEAWTGDWHGLDPTNGGPTGERHVTVGRARDYSDVSPLKGIFQGGPAEALGVTVELTRLA
ncbi:MAG: transglutaminase family protein [Actinomycetota bacterium]|nr:transglutaminase family protein [Actinomycetota bacterium]